MRDRLAQIFDNLLLNADHFAPSQTAIEVRVAPEELDRVTVRVIDHGPGLSPQVRDQLFKRFVTTDRRSGTGLGLAITRGLVEAHAGTIALEDSPEGGARFRFTLPRAEG